MKIASWRIRLVATATLAAMALLAFSPLTSPARAATAPGIQPAEEEAFGTLINSERQSRGLGRLAVLLHLTRLAREHSARMAADDDAGGSCTDGRTLRHRPEGPGGVTVPWTELAENVGCGPSVDPVHLAFMNSPTHRDNILLSNIESMGMGVVRSREGTMWVTQLFLRGTTPSELPTVDEGIAASRAAFPDGSHAAFAVVSRSDVFADSLGGAALAGGLAPVLFTDAPNSHEPDPVLRPATHVEIDRALGGIGTVYLLGGTGAVSSRVESELASDGYTITRLAGATRFETAAAVAEETVRLRGNPQRILIASGNNWPDAIAGGVVAARAGLPVLLTAQDNLPDATASFLSKYPLSRRVVLGGQAAVGDAVVRLAGADRVAGATRVETALAIVKTLFEGDPSRLLVADGFEQYGWGRTLAWTSYAADQAAPTIIVAGEVPQSVRDFVSGLPRPIDPVFTGGVSQTARTQMQALLAE
ncbi:MAG: cell wall-binding repeat-containing protein [Actinomycetota bacterium]